jgi:hypothetical protein
VKEQISGRDDTTHEAPPTLPSREARDPSGERSRSQAGSRTPVASSAPSRASVPPSDLRCVLQSALRGPAAAPTRSRPVTFESSSRRPRNQTFFRRSWARFALSRASVLVPLGNTQCDVTTRVVTHRKVARRRAVRRPTHSTVSVPEPGSFATRSAPSNFAGV